MSLGDRNLLDLTRKVFSNKYEFMQGPHKVKGKSGRIWIFDALVKDENALYGLFIRDWRREISITQLRQLHKACLDTKIQGGIMICNIVTDFSRDYSNQFGIQLLSKGHLISTLRRRKFQDKF